MNRRQFLQSVGGTALGLSLGAFPTAPLFAFDREKGAALLKGMLVIDPHAHPDMPSPFPGVSTTSYRDMKGIGMAASCFSAVGDMNMEKLIYYESAKYQLNHWINGLISKNNVKLILKSSDLSGPDPSVPGAILGLEGGDALTGSVFRVNEFHRLGVRIITIVHYHNNELGDIMWALPGSNPGTYNGGLTTIGKAVIEKMQELGIVIDVAHASANTIRDIVAIAQKPVIDSHTGLKENEDNKPRSRTWKEIEMIVSTGGVVCIWPMSYASNPRTFQSWANDILMMKKRFGIEHVGIGTDGGGLPYLIPGYRDCRDLVYLAEAMSDIGLGIDDIAAVMGLNIKRVMGEYF